MKTLLTIILILCVQGLHSQPVIALGNSRNAILYDNMDEAGWTLTCKEALKLTYVSDSATEFTYLFLKDEPSKVNRTCVEMLVTFTTDCNLNAYLLKKLLAGEVERVDEFTFKLVTDLYDLPVYLHLISDRVISIKY